MHERSEVLNLGQQENDNSQKKSVKVNVPTS